MDRQPSSQISPHESHTLNLCEVLPNGPHKVTLIENTPYHVDALEQLIQPRFGIMAQHGITLVFIIRNKRLFTIYVKFVSSSDGNRLFHQRFCQD